VKIRISKCDHKYLDYDNVSIKHGRKLYSLTFYPIKHWVNEWVFTEGLICLPFMDIYWG